MVLNKIKRMNNLVQSASNSSSVNFDQLTEHISKELNKTTAVIGKNGKVLGMSAKDLDIYSFNLDDSGFLDKDVLNTLLRIEESKANLKDLEIICLDETTKESYTYTVVPIYGIGERLATFVVMSNEGELGDDDLILCEYATALIAMEMVQSSKEKLAEEIRRKSAVKMAMGTLSFSEQEAIDHIFDELSGDEGLLVASKIADRVGITRSVIVNALRKFESAGIIESRSLGMKGTYIRVLNEKLFDELEKRRAR